MHIMTVSLASRHTINNRIYIPTTQDGHSQEDVLQDIAGLFGPVKPRTCRGNVYVMLAVAHFSK